MADISVFDFGDGVERNVKDATARSGLTGKADKVTSATSGNLTGLDANGNLTDSSIAASNVVVKSNTAGLLKNDGTVDTTTYANEQGVESLVDSTVGWTGKNLLPNNAVSQEINNVTYTVAADGKVTANGTASGGNANERLCDDMTVFNGLFGKKFYVSGAPVGALINNVYINFYYNDGSHHNVQVGNGASVLVDWTNVNSITAANVTIIVFEGKTASNVVFEPMIRLATVTDPTYEPYHKSVEECLEEINDKLSYLEQTVTLSTSASTTVTFTDSSITANSFIEYACSQWDLVPESITGAAGSCTIVLPKVDSAQSVTVRIYVR